MPRYYTIRNYEEHLRTRVLERLLDLRQQLDSTVPPSKPDSLLLATWNIRDFDSNKFRNGPRLPETFHYLAKVISRFDLVAVQEINRDLTPLNRLMYLLGNDWTFIMTGVTEGSSGNDAYPANQQIVCINPLPYPLLKPYQYNLSYTCIQTRRKA